MTQTKKLNKVIQMGMAFDDELRTLEMIRLNMGKVCIEFGITVAVHIAVTAQQQQQQKVQGKSLIFKT